MVLMFSKLYPFDEYMIFDKKASPSARQQKSKNFLANNRFDEITQYNVDVPQVTDVLM